MPNSPIESIRERLDQAKTIAIFAHIRPDGDSIGSVLALGWALQDAGKTVQFISQDGVPHNIEFLFDLLGEENPFIPEPTGADCLITPDISAVDRGGDFFVNHPEIVPDISIDHHASNPFFAKLNYIEPESPAACAVLTKLFNQLGLSITKRIANALLTGIMTDTIAFSTSGTDPETLRIAAELIEKGGELYTISQKAVKSRTFEASRFWQYGIAYEHRDGRIIWSILYQADREKSGYPGKDDADFVEHLANIEGFDVAIIFIEGTEQNVRISFRSKPGFDVSKVACAFGGGGHKAAAGANVEGSIEEVIPTVLQKTRELIFNGKE